MAKPAHAGEVDLDNLVIKKEKGNTFLVTANGITPDGEFYVNMHPVVCFRAPEDWLIIVSALQTPIHPHIATRWERSIEMVLGPETKRVTVQASNRAITVDVPH